MFHLKGRDFMKVKVRRALYLYHQPNEARGRLLNN